MYVVLWKRHIKLGRCDLSGSENLQKIYICHPIFFQENDRLVWKKPLVELDSSPEMSEINQRDTLLPSLVAWQLDTNAVKLSVFVGATCFLPPRPQTFWASDQQRNQKSAWFALSPWWWKLHNDTSARGLRSTLKGWESHETGPTVIHGMIMDML